MYVLLISPSPTLTYQNKQQMLQIQKKYGDRPPDSYKEWVKRARYLNDRGYSSEMIKDILEFSN